VPKVLGSTPTDTGFPPTVAFTCNTACVDDLLEPGLVEIVALKSSVASPVGEIGNGLEKVRVAVPAVSGCTNTPSGAIAPVIPAIESALALKPICVSSPASLTPTTSELISTGCPVLLVNCITPFDTFAPGAPEFD